MLQNDSSYRMRLYLCWLIAIRWESCDLAGMQSESAIGLSQICHAIHLRKEVLLLLTSCIRTVGFGK